MILQQIISQNTAAGTSISDVTTFTEVLTPSTDVTPDTILWFTPYLSALFPEIPCDKTYFFLYSTDHDSSDGGIWWGKGNNLDLSDFVEISSTPIVIGYQAETPFLYRFPNETEPIYLYYHTFALDPSNSGHQETHLITTTGGELHSASWTDRGKPLGSELGDDHTGYLKFWNNGVNLIGIHYKEGASPPNNIGVWQYSVIASDGFTATRGGLFDSTTHITSGRFVVPTYGTIFYLYGQWWWLGETETTTGLSLTSATKGLVLCKMNSDFEITEQVVELNGGDIGQYGFYPYISGLTAHIYIGSVSSGAMKYTTYNLIQLENYL